MRKETYSKNVGVLLSDEQYERLLWITDQLEMPLSEFIRMAVDEKMDTELCRLKQEHLSEGMKNGKRTNKSLTIKNSTTKPKILKFKKVMKACQPRILKK